MEATDSANTEMDYDNIARTIQPEEAQPDMPLERSSAEPEAVGQRAEECMSFAVGPEQPLDLPKPKKKGRPAGAQATYKTTRKNTTKTRPFLHLWQLLCKPSGAPPQGNAAVDRYDLPCYRGPLGQGVSMNTLADLMVERMTLRASDARAQRMQRWDKCMPHR